MTKVKICGLTDPDLVRHAAQEGADWVGFVLVEASPRYVTGAAAANLLLQAGGATPVALLADPDDALVDCVASIGFPVLQLHGQETPHRVAGIKARTGAEIWKAVGVSEIGDLADTRKYEAADRFLIDAKPPEGANRAGGHGRAFDWTILRDWQPIRPWILAGGLTPDNVAEAIHLTCAPAVDVSSGVEGAPGRKDRAKVSAFIRIAKNS